MISGDSFSIIGFFISLKRHSFILFLVNRTTSWGETLLVNINLSILFEYDILSNCSMLSSVIKRICTFIVCSSCNNNLKAYGTFTILNVLPNLLTCWICCSFPSNEPVNFSGPSAIGLIKMFLDGLYIAIIPVVLQTAIRYLSARSITDSRKKSLAPCEITTSRSISPIRRPPSLARPETG